MFYVDNNKLVNICDADNPEPVSTYGLWSPGISYDGSPNGNTTYGGYNTKILFPPTRMKKENFSEFMKINLTSLRNYADEHKIEGNLFIIKKVVKDEVLIGLAVYNAIGDFQVG